MKYFIPTFVTKKELAPLSSLYAIWAYFLLELIKASRIILKEAENLQDASCNLCVLSLTFKHILQQKMKLLKLQEHIILMSQLIT